MPAILCSAVPFREAAEPVTRTMALLHTAQGSEMHRSEHSMPHPTRGGSVFLTTLTCYSHQRCNADCSSCLVTGSFLCRWKRRSRTHPWRSCRPSALPSSNAPQGMGAPPKTEVTRHCWEASVSAVCLHTQFSSCVLDTFSSS